MAAAEARQGEEPPPVPEHVAGGAVVAGGEDFGVAELGVVVGVGFDNIGVVEAGSEVVLEELGAAEEVVEAGGAAEVAVARQEQTASAEA